MNSHELAKKLLSEPDLKIFVENIGMELDTDEIDSYVIKKPLWKDEVGIVLFEKRL